MAKIFSRKTEKGLKKLNVGCGTDYKDGWVNIDNNSDNNIEKLDMNVDLRDGLPFEDETVDYIFNEHFFEHLTPEKGVFLMKDMLRVLKPGGKLRIAMPDLEQIVDAYSHLSIEDDPVVRDFSLDFIKTRAERINVSFRYWGHEWLYDWEELVRRLLEAGFSEKKITRHKMGESDDPLLRNLETRDGSYLVAEVIK